MEESLSASKLAPLKKSQILLSPTHPKQKMYLPSRYGYQRNLNKNGFHQVLNSIQSNMKTLEIQKKPNTANKGIIPSPIKNKSKAKLQIDQLKSNQSNDFRSKPMKRQQSDMLNFKQIFIEPRQQVLKKIQLKGKQNYTLNIKKINKDYDKLLEFQNGIGEDNGTTGTTKIQKIDELVQSDVPKYYKECIEILDKEKIQNVQQQDDFYQQHIRIEPPDLPNSSIASTLAPGSGYAPSIPLNASNLTKQQANLRQLLMRAKAGMNTQDIQKQAHLSFFLGVVYQQRKQYVSALKFYRRHLGFAKAMQDKIGMALGSNRVAINYFYHGDINKSISFHNQNLKLSDNQNCFAGFYNLGICYRKLNKFNQSIQHFETALQWANQKGQIESQCITYGQLAMTYQCMELYQQSLDNYQKSLNLCNKLKKTKLALYNLRSILRITSQFQLRSSKNLLDIALQAYQCSKSLDNKKMMEIYGCNIGIIRGYQEFNKIKTYEQVNKEDDIEEIIDNEDDNNYI